jgi:photosystem II stability/assembly factor-like uncharacterized protein
LWDGASDCAALNRFFLFLPCALTRLCAVLVLFCATINVHAQPLQWEQTNGPYGGNITCFVTSGTMIFAGTDTGGMFRSLDNGEHWIQINTGLAGRNISSLVVRGTTLFAGTDNGIFRSTDNGTSWTAASTGLPNQANVSSFTVSGTSIFSGTYGNGVFRSNDNGTTWTQANTGLSNTRIRTLAVSGSTLFAGTERGVFRAPLTGTTAVHTQPAQNLALTHYPNPFTAQTTLEYELSRAQRVRLAIISPLGQTLLTLVDEMQQAGKHSVSADMSAFASGVYVARLQAGGVLQTTLLRLAR